MTSESYVRGVAWGFMVLRSGDVKIPMSKLDLEWLEIPHLSCSKGGNLLVSPDVR